MKKSILFSIAAVCICVLPFLWFSCDDGAGEENSFVAVTGITDVPTDAKAGDILTLRGTVKPSNATAQTIAWSVKTVGTTGAEITGNKLTATAAGTVTVTATVAKGKSETADYTQDFDIAVSPPAFVAVTNIADVRLAVQVNDTLTLSGTVEPANATNKTIAWSVKTDGGTGAIIAGVGNNELTAGTAGTVTVMATIANGAAEAADYTQDFDIEVTTEPVPFVPVTNIAGVPGTATVGTGLPLAGTVEPANATNKTIAWSVKTAGTTGAVIVDGTLTAASAGTVTVTATIANGASEITAYTQDFDITASSYNANDPIDQENATDTYHGTTATTKNVIPAGIKNSLGVPVIHEVWMGVDTNNDPRNAIGYKLKTSGKQYFDNAVIFHFNMYDKDCPSDPEMYNYCPTSGFHLHYLDEIQWLLANYDEYIKPLKDAGIRVLMGLLPSGDGVCFGTLGSWPMEPIYPWSANNSGQAYPYDEAAAQRFAKEVADACAFYGFDGIAMDDEYGNKGGAGGGRQAVYPSYSGQLLDYQWTASYSQADAWDAGGENVFRFLRYFKDYTTDAQHPNGKWVSNYEYHYLAELPTQLDVDDPTTGAVGSQTSRHWTIDQVVDASFPASYGSQVLASSIGVSPSHYGFLSLKMYESPSPAVTTVGPTFNKQLTNGFGIIMYFSLISRSEYGTGNFFGGLATMPEKYFSKIANTFYQDDVIYDGPANYPKFGPGGDTNGTHELYP
ncbi:MAG: hypothetical protein LBS97_04535 [Treponema sp.]|nr:hypothetical protein [Treponema sp.]